MEDESDSDICCCDVAVSVVTQRLQPGREQTSAEGRPNFGFPEGFSMRAAARRLPLALGGPR